LVVVDYAQAVSEPLSHLLGVLMAKRSELLPPLRVLLLERHAGEWFQTLARKEDSNRKPIGELFNPDSNRGWVQEPPYMTLKPITDTDLRRDLFDQTLSQAERIAGTLSPPADASDYSDLARDIFGDPLNVMLAAVAAVDIGVPRALEAGRLDLANDVANKELRLLDRFAPEERYQRVLRHMAACATLESGFDEQGLDRAIDEELAALKRNWVGGEGDLADVLRRVFPDSNNAVAPVTPDLVGEALVLLVLAARERRRGWPEVVSRCAARAPQKTPYTLLKAFQNFWDQADSGEVLLDAVLTIVAGAKDASHLLTAIEHALPDENAQAIDMTRRLYEFLKRSPTQKPDFARIAYNLGVRLHQQGRTGEALDVTQDAVISYSELNERDPAFALQLAEAHGHLATCLGNVGRHHEAYDHACIAVEVYRKLAPLRRQEIEPNLARALDNFANHSAALGRHAEAVALAGEAFTLWRELSRSLRAELLPDLARSSGNFANHLMIAGRDVEAMDAARESLTIYRELDLAYPRNNHKPAVAASLARLGRLQQLTGLLEAAVESYHSGIEVLKDPFRDSRERYELLMQSLRQNYIDVCVALGREPDDLWLQAVTT
jgi:tetratricopeptide (TPR) repeat protein